MTIVLDPTDESASAHREAIAERADEALEALLAAVTAQAATARRSG